MHDRPTRLVLLGHPVSHSLSPLFQNAALKSAGISATYDALDVPAVALPGVLHELARAGVAGNVTIPHKEAMRAACVGVSDVALRVGAVNTFWHEKGKLIGDNTDVGGARVAIAALMSTSGGDALSKPLRVAVLGAGGAAAAVLVALDELAPERITLWSRSPERARALALRLGVLADTVETAEEAVRGATLVINTTPIGLADDALPVNVERLEAGTRVLDLIPKRGDTAWVRECRGAGLVAEDGLRMLVEQGAASFERWFGVVPDRAAMWRSLGMRSETASRASGARASTSTPNTAGSTGGSRGAEPRGNPSRDKTDSDR